MEDANEEQKTKMIIGAAIAAILLINLTILATICYCKLRKQASSSNSNDALTRDTNEE